jgi:drug/metabolite transporter (DMT)-like permease
MNRSGFLWTNVVKPYFNEIFSGIPAEILTLLVLFGFGGLLILRLLKKNKLVEKNIANYFWGVLILIGVIHTTMLGLLLGYGIDSSTGFLLVVSLPLLMGFLGVLFVKPRK